MKRMTCLSVVSMIAISMSCNHQDGPSRGNNTKPSGSESSSTVNDPQFQTPSFVQPRGEQQPVLVDGKSPEQAARDVLGQRAKDIGIDDFAAEFELERISTDGLGMTHVAFRQIAGGYPVYGVRYTVHFDKTGRLGYISGRYVAGISKTQFSADIDSEQALSSVAKHLQKEVGPDVLKAPLKEPSVKPVVYALDNRARLAYDVEIAYFTDRLIAMQYVIDAADGSVLASAPVIYSEDVDGSGAGVLYHAMGNTSDIKHFKVKKTKIKKGSDFVDNYQLIRTKTAEQFGIKVYDASNCSSDMRQRRLVESEDPNKWDDTGNSPGQAVDGYYNLQLVGDYHRDVHSRLSLDGRNKDVDVYVHLPQAADNAFYWNGSIYGGDIVVSTLDASYIGCLDVFAHEFQHGVIDNTLHLVYEGQSGAMNEAIADIFGAFVEHFYEPDEIKNMQIAEKCRAPNSRPFRDMANPQSVNKPDHMNNFRNWPIDEANDWGGVHTNSSIVSHAWYLMTKGGKNATSEVEVTEPLEWKNSEKLWNSIVEGTSHAATASFADIARVTIATAYQLGNADSDQSKSASVQTIEVDEKGEIKPPVPAVRAVGCAWFAVGVLTEEEIKKHWGITCDGDVDDAPKQDCFTGGEDCKAGQLCSWNGINNGYCCKSPWKGTQVCYSDAECGEGGICSLGSNNTYYCTKPNEVACIDNSKKKKNKKKNKK